MEAPVEIRYAGVVIGQAQESRSTSDDNLSFFISLREPMPVGSVLRLRSGDREAPVRVVHVVESTDKAGMTVRLLDEAEAAAPPAVEQKPAPVAAAVAAVPAVEAAPVEVVAVAPAAPEVAAPTAAAEASAIPEAVPTAVGSSMTGALQQAAEKGIADPSNESGAAEGSTRLADSAAGETAPSENPPTTPAAEATPTGEELPPARPLANPTGRRKSKRRK